MDIPRGGSPVSIADMTSAHAGHKDGPFKDGGLYDRTGLVAWRRRRSLSGKGVPPALIHLIARSSNFSGADDVENTGV